jgi:hypothetical protein
MNDTAPHPLPPFRELYWMDFAIRRLVSATGMGVMIAAGFWWASRPMPNAVPLPEPGFEAWFAPWMIAFGIVLAVVSGLLLLARYQRVRKILTEGSVVTGTAVEVDVFDTNQNSDSTTNRFSRTYAYYVTIRFECQGREREVRFKLLHSPSTYGIRKDGDVELLVLDQAPAKPLIRSVYTVRPRIGRPPRRI